MGQGDGEGGDAVGGQVIVNDLVIHTEEEFISSRIAGAETGHGGVAVFVLGRDLRDLGREEGVVTQGVDAGEDINAPILWKIRAIPSKWVSR